MFIFTRAEKVKFRTKVTDMYIASDIFIKTNTNIFSVTEVRDGLVIDSEWAL